MEAIDYTFGIMSNKHQVTATNKFTAYAVMCFVYKNNPNMIVIYSPEASKKDTWTCFEGKSQEKLDRVFGGNGMFEEYVKKTFKK
jgi:hypothetical protein